MNLAAWTERNGVARVSANRWFRAGLLPVPAQRVGRLILVDEPTGAAEVDDDLVRDMTEILTITCARLYGKHAAANRAQRGVTAAADAVGREAA
jgi:predicted site-specific integrase-resolvase